MRVSHRHLFASFALGLTLLNGGSAVAERGPLHEGVACLDVAVKAHLELPQFLAQNAGHPDLLNLKNLERRADEMTKLFASLSAKVESRAADAVRYRELPMQDTVLPMASVRKVFPDYDSETEFIIGLQEGNAEGRPHSYLLIGGLRFDGALMGDPSWDPRRSDLIIRGLVFRVRNVPRETIEKLVSALQTNPKIRDLTCYTSITRFLETKGDIHLVKDHPGLPLLPSEVVAALLQDRLRLKGQALSLQPVNLMPVPFMSVIQKFLSDENALIPLLEPHIRSLHPGVKDYHQTLGWD